MATNPDEQPSRRKYLIPAQERPFWNKMAMKQVETGGGSLPAIAKPALRATKFNDFFLRNAYLRVDGRMVRDMYLMEAKKPAESKSEWDLAKLKRVIPGEEAYMSLAQSACPLVKK
jgi:branched-chain amino acid transport system substrate-binding protein